MALVPLDLDTSRRALGSALLARDSGRARRAALETSSAGIPPGDVVLEVLTPVLHEIGERWRTGQLTVADEHYATAVVERLVHEFAGRMRRPPAGGRLAIVSCTPGEQHALGARVASDFLEADGWEVLHLGASTPTRDLLALIEAERPDLVALSTTTAAGLPEIETVFRAVAAADPRPVLAAGGQVWTVETGAYARELGADWVGRDPRLLVATLRSLVPRGDA